MTTTMPHAQSAFAYRIQATNQALLERLSGPGGEVCADVARQLAADFVEGIAAQGHITLIAGGLRRGKSAVRDVDLVVGVSGTTIGQCDDLCRLKAAASQDTHGDLVPPTLSPDRPVRAGS